MPFRRAFAAPASLASLTQRESFARQFLRPYGIDEEPDVLYWARPDPDDGWLNASLERPGTGTRFNSQGQLETIPANVIRRDYDPVGGFRGALAEPQRENLLLWSEDFSNAVWNKVGIGTGVAPVVTPNDAIAPDGELAADRIDFNRGAGTTSTDRSIVSQIASFTSGLLYSMPLFVKAATLTDVGKEIGVRQGAGGVYEAITLTNSWQRVTTLETAFTTGNIAVEIASRFGQTADAQVSAHIWGAQLEQAAFPSSYIKTEATTVTRPADTLTIPQVGDRRRGLIVWQGSPVFDAAAGSGANAVLRFPFGRSDTEQAIRIVGATGIEAISPSAADVQAVTALSTLQGRKSCIAYWWDGDANVFGVSVDGVSAVNSATTFSAPASDPIRIGQTAANRSGLSHTEWAFISYQVPPVDKINALTGGVL